MVLIIITGTNIIPNPISEKKKQYSNTIALKILAPENYMQLWNDTFGNSPPSDYGRKVVVYGDFIYVSGATQSLGTGGDLLLMKYHRNGTQIWVKNWGGAGDDDGIDIAISSNGEYLYIGGQTTSFGNAWEAFLVKYSTNGTYIWNQTWGGVNNEGAYAIAISPDDSAIYLSGYTNTYTVGDYDLALIKYDSAGNKQWNVSWGASGKETGWGIHATNTFIVTGGETSSFGPSVDGMLVAYDTTSTELWNTTFGGSNWDQFYAMTIVNNTDIYAVGRTSSFGPTGENVYITKYNSSGAHQWNTTWGGVNNERGEDIVLSSLGTLIISGSTNSFTVGGNDAAILHYDIQGSRLSNTTWGTSDTEDCYGVASIEDEIIIVGRENVGGSNWDAFIVAFELDGLNPPPEITVSNIAPSPTNTLTTVTITNITESVTQILVNVTGPSFLEYHSATYQGLNQWTFQFTPLIDGIYTIACNATDITGKYGYANGTVYADLTPPTLTSSISPNPTNGLTNVSIFNTSEAVNQVLVNISGPGYFAYRYPTYLGGNQWICQFTPPVDGLYTILINGTDFANNYGYASNSVTADLAAPTLNVTTTPNPTNTLTLITISNTSEPVNNVLVNITGPGFLTYLNGTYQGANQWTCQFTPPTDGLYLIKINATDLSQNVGYVSDTVVADFTAPNLTIQSITQNPDTSIISILVQNISEPLDANGIQLQITTPSNNKLYLNLTYISGNLWNGNFTPSEAGNHIFVVNGTDLAGNEGNDTDSFEATLPSAPIPSFNPYLIFLLIFTLISIKNLRANKEFIVP